MTTAKNETEKPKRVFLVTLGFPMEFSDLEVAHTVAAGLLEKHGGNHATILTVDADWKDWTLVAENVGTVFSTPSALSIPVDDDTAYDYL